MLIGSRLLCLLLIACGLSSAPVGSMEQTPDRGSSVSVPHAVSVREAKPVSFRLPDRDRAAADDLRHSPLLALATAPRPPAHVALVVAASAPPHGGLELAALLGFHANAPPPSGLI
jgi:hypothetical protein